MSTASLEARKRRPHRYDASLQGHKLTIAYRGTDFAGWQIQPGKRTVQQCLEDAIQKIWRQKISLQGSGRTDTGVHARGQVASFNAPRLHTAAVVLRALNANLPRDVRIVQCRLVSPAFHARFDARGKTYRYQVWNHPVQDPFTLDTHWHVPLELDLAAMRKAARLLVGRHDFASFTSNPGYERETTVRTMRRVSVVREGHALVFHFTADGFL
jgi:tRNA pseudouridine38-40 synthase